MTPDRPAAPNNSNPPADPLRVLVIDPNEDHQLLTVTALAPRGYQVKAASASREGLRLLEGPRFDAILVDAKLRDIGALEMLAILAERCGDVPRILLVPVGGDEIALKGLEAGATAFVMKSPSYRVVLPAVVDRQVRDVRSRRHMTEALAEMWHARVLTMSVTILLTSGSICRAVERSRVTSFLRGLPAGLVARLGVLLMLTPGVWRGSRAPPTTPF